MAKAQPLQAACGRGGVRTLEGGARAWGGELRSSESRVGGVRTSGGGRRRGQSLRGRAGGGGIRTPGSNEAESGPPGRCQTLETRCRGRGASRVGSFQPRGEDSAFPTVLLLPAFTLPVTLTSP